MSILIDSDTKVIVQGITGSEGTFHSEQMIDYGTNIVAGVTPGKGGSMVLESIPVYNTVEEAKNTHGANASIIFVPPRFAAEAITESIKSEIHLPITGVSKLVNTHFLACLPSFLLSSSGKSYTF